MAENDRMDWKKLLSAERLSDKAYQPHKSRSVFVQDHDRIVFSAPFRRLANKTQVQPLYENDHVHHRLIHSIEVSSVGRSLAMRVGQWLSEKGEIKAAQVHDVADIVQAACVAHDIGNPPFGHSGEEAMGAWFAEKFERPEGIFADIATERSHEFKAFEGNAQGFRILTRLELYRGDGGMLLSNATLGAFSKYPVTAADRQAIVRASPDSSHYVGLKKFGIFQSDVVQFRAIANALGLPEVSENGKQFWRRHPLVFLMEAADDITYNIVDMEDAFTSGELPFEVVQEKLRLTNKKERSSSDGLTEGEQIAQLRAQGIGDAIDACVKVFQENYEAIMDGTFSDDLIGASDLSAAFSEIKKTARDRIFTAPRKTELELSGRRTIANVMSGILPVYEDLAGQKWQVDQLSAHSEQLCRALSLDLRDLTDAESALHALADFTSGMTDRYALRISRMLSGT